MAEVNNAQREFWSETVGPSWVRRQEQMDRLMQPVLDHLWPHAELKAGQCVMDVGSGTGASTGETAHFVGEDGNVLGADISVPMTAMASERLKAHENVDFVVADVADHAFEPAVFDNVVSRFGLMFFEDPTPAFANIRAAMKPGAALTFAAWSGPETNPFFTTQAAVATSILGPLPKPDPTAPGPLAFRDADRVLGILKEAGFKEARVSTESMMLDGGTSEPDLIDAMCEISPQPLVAAYSQADAEQVHAIRTAFSEALKTFSTPDGFRIPAEIHYFKARA